jgi:hypothetical protein
LLTVTEKATLDRGQDATGEQEVVQTPEQVVGAGLIGGGQEVLCQAFAHRIGLAGIGTLGGLALGLFVFEVAPVAAFALSPGAGAVGTGRRRGAVLESVNKVIEGGGGRGVEGLEAGDMRQAGMAPEVAGPLGHTFVVQQEHQEQGAQHAEGVVGRPAAWTWGVEGLQEGAGRVEIEAQQDQGGLLPGLWEAA